MPFLSKRQARWMFANKPAMAKEWAAATPSLRRLPERVVRPPRKPRLEDLVKRRL